MLVLNRKPDQTIYIGDDIKVTVVRIQGGAVKLGIEADKSVKVLRAELKEKPCTS